MLQADSGCIQHINEEKDEERESGEQLMDVTCSTSSNMSVDANDSVANLIEV